MILTPLAQAITVWYQPTPYPLWKYGSTPANPKPMPQDLSIVHTHDGWLNSYYPSIMTFQRDGKMKIGGWGDFYRAYYNIDMAGLPKDVPQAVLYLRFFPSGAAGTPVRFCVPNVTWDTAITWGAQPTVLGCTGYYTPPTTDAWWGVGITTWWQNWQSGTWGKYGFRLEPQYNNNNFDLIRSSQYKDFVADPYADQKRPIWQFDFTPTLQLKMPLPGGYSWLLTTEIGGYDCRGKTYDSNGNVIWPDAAHQGLNYFSIDLAPTGSGYVSSIPILAAANGKIIEIGNNALNGNYIAIDHDSDGNALTGFQTRYLHLADVPKRKNGVILSVGNTVVQGDQIGIMGNTGASDGTHLHFGIRYGNGTTSSGAVTVQELAKVVMEGMILKSYQSECSTDTNGVPITWIRRYTSTLTPTGN